MEDRRSGLTLAELEASASGTLAVLLALLLAGVAGDVPDRLQLRPQIAVDLHQGPGDPVADRAGLRRHAAAADGGEDIVLTEERDLLEGLADDHPRGRPAEVV